MAFFTSNEDEEKKSAEGGTAGGAMRTAEAGFGQAASGGGATGAAAPAPSKPKGSGWTNLKSYIGANVGEGERMAGNIVGKAGEEAGKDVGAINQEASTQQAALSSYKPNVAAADYFADPTKIEATDFSKYYNQGLSQDLKDFNTANVGSKPDIWRQKADLANQGMSGVGALAGEYLGKGVADYGGGKRNLDAFLMGGSSLGKGMAEKAQGVEDALVKAQTDYGIARKGKEAEIKGAQEKFRELFTAARNAEAQKAYDAFSGKGGMADYIQQGDMAGYLAAGQKADARERALAQLVGQDVAGRDWAAKWTEKRAPIEEALAAARNRSGAPQGGSEANYAALPKAAVLGGVSAQNYSDMTPEQKKDLQELEGAF